MFLLFFALWLIFNSRVTLELVVFGLVISALLYAFICVFLGFSLKTDLRLILKLPYAAAFLAALLYEIFAANFSVMHLVVSPEYDPDPVLIRFRSGISSPYLRVLLADSITLTPGTITVELEGDFFTVHCLDRTFAPGIADSRIVRAIRRLDK